MSNKGELAGRRAMVATQKPPLAVVEVDGEGFLVQPGTWTRDVACVLAQGEVSGNLTEGHWKVIDCLRDHYLEFDIVPPDRMIARRTGYSLEYIYELFPSGIVPGVCKIAGIPRGGICCKRF